MNDTHLCGNTTAETQHSIKEAEKGGAPVFSEIEYRSEAEALVCKALIKDSIAALDNYSLSHEEFDRFLYRVGQMVRSDVHFMNTLITNSVLIDQDEIQMNLESH